MRPTSRTALAALLTTAIGLAAFPASAQDLPQPPAAPAAEQPPAGFRLPERIRHHMGGGLFDLRRGAEAVEVGLVRLSHRVELTDEQRPLFEALRTAALDAAATYDAAVAQVRPDREATPAEAPDVTEFLDQRITLASAHLAALEAIQPAFAAFVDSLSEEQRAALLPEPREGGDRPGMFGKFGPRHHQHGGPGAGPGQG